MADVLKALAARVEQLAKLTKIDQRVLAAADRLYHVEQSMKVRRGAWRQLKRDHNGELVCLKDNRIDNPEYEPCEACQAFKVGDNYSDLLKQRQRAKRAILTATARRLQATSGERRVNFEAQTNGGVDNKND